VGESESDAKLEKHTAAEMATANSEKSRPTSPSRKVMGTNTARSTTVEAITAKPSSRVPL